MGNSKDNIKVWWDGKILPFQEAKVPILNHSMQYGSGIFEGIRAYETDRGVAIFRLEDHVRRFLRSMKIYRMVSEYGEMEIINAILEIVKANNFENCYIRPFIFYFDDNIPLPVEGKKTSLYIVPLPMGKYLENASGLKCKISSWTRINSDSLPIQAKASGNYLNSLIAVMEARENGFDEAIMIDRDGYVGEGSAENLFLVEDGMLFTPSLDSSALKGITRDTIIRIAKMTDLEVQERRIHREELYTADEVFLCGTAIEIAGVINVDGRMVGNGKEGVITRRLRERYGEVVRGKFAVDPGWLNFV